MIIVWSSSSSGPYALIIPIALVVLSAFLEDFDVVLQGLRAGLSGFVGLAAVLAALALACKVLSPALWIRVKRQCAALLERAAAALHAPPQQPRPAAHRPSARMSTGGRAPEGSLSRWTPAERFTAIARAVQQLPTQLYLSEEDLLGKSAQELKGLMRQQGLPWRDGEVMDKQDAIQRILDSSDSSSQSCPVCCEDYQQGDVLRVLRCKHKFHLECIDRWCLASADRSTMPACPMCNQPVS